MLVCLCACVRLCVWLRSKACAYVCMLAFVCVPVRICLCAWLQCAVCLCVFFAIPVCLICAWLLIKRFHSFLSLDVSISLWSANQIALYRPLRCSKVNAHAYTNIHTHAHARAAHARTRTRTRTRTHAHAHAHMHTRTRTSAHNHNHNYNYNYAQLRNLSRISSFTAKVCVSIGFRLLYRVLLLCNSHAPGTHSRSLSRDERFRVKNKLTFELKPRVTQPSKLEG